MSEITVKRVHPAMRDDIGDLLTQRPLPSADLSQIDPYLFLNHHGPQVYPPANRGLPFGPHPHRGFETVTFIIDGQLMHSDSAGHDSVIGAGGVQWMTAGSGLVHAELSPPAFMREGGALEILQLWVNLPGRLKMTAPQYIGLQAGAIPVIEEDGVSLRLVAGQWRGRQGPVDSLTGHFMSIVTLAPGAHLRIDELFRRNVLLYVIRGGIEAGPDHVSAMHLAELGSEGDHLHLRSEHGAMVLFGHAAPLAEPVVAHGPFVMNTREEIAAAIADYQAGRFGAPRSVSSEQTEP
jgi:redox-sensitive bicupin YhaK (pirin superfamily)